MLQLIAGCCALARVANTFAVLLLCESACFTCRANRLLCSSVFLLVLRASWAGANRCGLHTPMLCCRRCCCCVLQSEVAMHCFGLAEARSHASSGNMKPAPCISSADGAHNSCPQVLHSQMSAPAGQLQAAAAGEAYHIPSFHQPSPLGQQQRKQPAAAGSGLGAMATGAVGAGDAYANQQLLPAGFVMVQTQQMQDGDMEVDAAH